MLNIGINFDLKPLHRALLDFGNKQVKFAAADALTKLAKGVSELETTTVSDTFDSPTPFTQKGFRIVPATKDALASFVMAKDIQAQYLAPYIFGGPRFIGNKRAMLVPKQVGVNQYGNLPRNKLASLKGRKDIFVGVVKLRTGETINGVWQRPSAGVRRDGARGTKGALGKIGNVRTGLKLLIRFEDTTETSKRFPFFERAEDYVRRHARAEFEAALTRALASAR
ncbi:hypothetical protein [Novosphingobium sp. FSW06-99]|uniref:hypothetical protein n=1 Tax=Novosphingobium sp. FSW06-99 TaxID=1739113 RepID=UPI00076D23C0|nr:hypothetical protein [Novosphingobium sp. FSW06-99]KUR80770.1 hypothetical protein AQZ49_01715 [Novosphingobium sp. FSW06-99]